VVSSSLSRPRERGRLVGESRYKALVPLTLVPLIIGVGTMAGIGVMSTASVLLAAILLAGT
jgi:hypothetical protein